MKNARTSFRNAEAERVGKRLWSVLILAGVSVSNVRAIATSEAMPCEVARCVQTLCDRFARYDRSANDRYSIDI
jgi:hypothetical protein